MNEGVTGNIPQETKVFVTGATGFVGSALVRKLIQMGLQVKALARLGSNRSPLQDLPMEWVLGDICDEKALAKGVQGVSYIFHLASTYRNHKAAAEEHHRVHVKGTELLAKLALKEPGLKRFLHVSTVGVHGHIENPPANETYPFSPGDDYQRTKAEAEIWIRDFAEKTGLPLTVVRPAPIYGPGDNRLFKIFKMAYQSFFPVIGSGNNLLHFIHIDDLTNFFILAASRPKALGEVFICAGEKALSLREMVAIIEREYKTKTNFISVPAGAAFLLADLCEKVCRPFHLNPPLYRRRLTFYTNDRSFNAHKMKEVLEFTPKHSQEEGIREVARWYLENGWLNLGRRAEIPHRALKVRDGNGKNGKNKGG